MAREETEKEIDGIKYTFCQLGAIKAHRLLLKLGKIVGPAIGAMANTGDGVKGLLGADIDLEDVLDSLFERADEATIDSILVTLGSQIHYAKTEDQKGGVLNTIDLIDLHFTGRLPSMYKVMIAALGAQYGDFLEEGGIVENIKAKIKASDQKK
jgi:hypothetical protein